MAQSEAPSSLFQTGESDPALAFFAAGDWEASLSTGIGLNYSDLLGLGLSSGSGTILFAQKPSLILSASVLDRFFIDAGITDSLEADSVVIGYRGAEGDFLRSIELGNGAIGAPIFPSIAESGPSDRALALAMIAGGAPPAQGKPEDFLGALSLRLDTVAGAKKRWIGGKEAVDTLIEPSSWIRGRWFVLPGPVEGLRLFAESGAMAPGALLCEDGRHYAELPPSAFDWSALSGEIRLAEASGARIIARYSVGGVPASDSGYALDGQPAVLLFDPSRENPYEDARHYPLGGDSSAPLAELFIGERGGHARKPGYIVERVESGGEPTLLARKLSAAPGDAAWLKPLIDDEPALYAAPGIAASAPTAIVIVARRLMESEGYALGPGVSPSSVAVFRDGRPESGFRFDAQSGKIEFDVPPGPFELIEARYSKVGAPGTGNGVSASLGGKWNISPELSAYAAIGTRLSLGLAGHSLESGAAPGGAKLSAGMAYSAQDAALSVAGLLDYSIADVMGRLLLDTGRASEIEHAYYDSGCGPADAPASGAGLPRILTGAARAALPYYDHMDGLLLTGVEWPGASLKPLKEGPYLVQGGAGVSGTAVAIRYGFSGGKDWSGFRTPLSQGIALSLAKASSLSLPLRWHRFSGSGSPPRVYFQAGALGGGPEGYAEGALFTRELSQGLDLSDSQWHAARIDLSPEERAILSAARGFRLIVIGESGVDAEGAILCGALRAEAAGWAGEGGSGGGSALPYPGGADTSLYAAFPSVAAALSDGDSRIGVTFVDIEAPGPATAGIARLVAASQPSLYEGTRFLVKLPPALGPDAAMALSLESARGEALASVELPLAGLGSGWIEVDAPWGSIPHSRASESAPFADIAGAPMVVAPREGSAAVARVSFTGIEDARIALAGLRLEGSRAGFQASLTLSGRARSAETILSAWGLALVAKPRVSGSAEFRASESSAYASGRARAGADILFLSIDAEAALATDGSWDGSHEIALVPGLPLKAFNRFSLRPGDSAFTAASGLSSALGPVTASIEASSSLADGTLGQAWSGEAAFATTLPPPRAEAKDQSGAGKPLEAPAAPELDPETLAFLAEEGLSAEDIYPSRPESAAAEPTPEAARGAAIKANMALKARVSGAGSLGAEDYFGAWIDSLALILPSGEEQALSRSLEGSFGLNFEPLPLGIELSARGTSAYAGGSGASGSELASIALALPLAIEGGAKLMLSYAKELVGRSSVSPRGGLSGDLERWAGAVARAGPLWAGIPFAELFGAGVDEAFPAASAPFGEAAYRARASASASRPPSRALLDFFLPREAEYALERQLGRNLDATKVALVHRLSLKGQSQNLFSASGAHPIALFVAADEYSQSISLEAAFDGAGAFSSAGFSAKHFARFGFDSGAALSAEHSMRLDAKTGAFKDEATISLSLPDADYFAKRWLDSLVSAAAPKAAPEPAPQAGGDEPLSLRGDAPPAVKRGASEPVTPYLASLASRKREGRHELKLTSAFESNASLSSLTFGFANESLAIIEGALRFSIKAGLEAAWKWPAAAESSFGLSISLGLGLKMEF